jgi:hypothetical protein
MYIHAKIAGTVLLLLGMTVIPKLAAQTIVDREQVADLTFPPLAMVPVALGGDEYETRFILRFADPDSEIVIETHTNKPKTVDLYTLPPGLTIWSETGRIQRQNLNATPQDVAASIHVRRTSLKIGTNQVDHWLHALGSISPPIVLDLGDWLNLHQVPRFDLWIDSGSASVRYSFTYAGADRTNPGYPLAPLAQWMLQVRSEVEENYNKRQ